MNSLSWFLYLTDAIGNVKNVLIGAAVASTAYVVLRTGITAAKNDFDSYEIKRGDKKPMPYPAHDRWASAVVGLALAAALIPSQGTLYAIAASEAGEQIVKTEAVQGMASDAQKALHQWIKRQIEPEAKK